MYGKYVRGESMWKIYILLIMLLVNSCDQLLPPNLKAKIDQNERVKLNVGRELIPKVDILFVIDNSGSMSSHQIHLKNQIEYYANEILKITAIDFHIAVLGSDSVRGLSNAYLTRSTPNVINLLKQSLLLGSSGSAVEKFFEPVYSALKYNTYAPNSFLRKDATLNLIFITDTDDQSEGLSSIQFYNFLLNIKQDSTQIITFSALIVDSICKGERTADDISRLKQFMHISQGTVVNLCSDYAQSLITLAKKVVRQSLVFKLTEVPIYESIILSYGSVTVPRSIDEGWSYNPKTVSIRLSPNFFQKMSEQNIIGKIQISYKKARPGDL